jgi:hypothetical protein
MSKPTIYRKSPLGKPRTIVSLTTDEQTKVSEKITSFFTYFKAKHT